MVDTGDVTVPVIAPVDDEIDNPPGKAPEVTAKEIVPMLVEAPANLQNNLRLFVRQLSFLKFLKQCPKLLLVEQ